MINTVIFDMDGLLIDSEIVYFHIVESLIAQYGGRFTLESYVRDNSGRTIDDNAAIYVQKYHLPITREEAKAAILKKEGEYRENPGIPLKAGARDLLKYLKAHGYHVSLATSSLKDRAVSILKKAHVEEYFDDLTCASDVTKGKPDPEVFLKAAEKAGADPADCLVLEDSENGIQAGKAAGMKVICVPDLKEPDERHRNMADAVVKSLADVPELLEGFSHR